MQSDNRPIRVLIAEDQDLVRQSLQIILGGNDSIEVIGAAGDGIEALEMVGRLRPDIVLLDIRMPRMDGVTACKKIKESYPDVKVIVLTTFDDDDYIFNAIKYGASGYILKGISIDELITAIITVWQGGALINPNICSKLVQFFSEMANGGQPLEPNKADFREFSATEASIVKLIYEGCSNKEIAKKLYLSEGTVRNYISRILSRLHLRDRTQIVIYYFNAVYMGKKERINTQEDML
jgi:DNA-binding NarL/FixJ family response regulator